MKQKFAFLCSLLLLTAGVVNKSQAQELLTLEDAVKITLENNYDIKLSANDLRIDKNNVNLANAGILPAVTGTLTNNNSIQNSRQVRADGEVQERNNARSSNLNYGVGLTWNIFDGFGMFARYNQLQEFQRLGEAELQLTILGRVADVITNYFALVQQQQQLQANLTAIDISRFRVKTAQSRFEIGKAARLEVLNAQVDLNTDTTNYLRQQDLYRNTQILLNELLARDVNIAFKVADTVIIDNNLTLAQMSERAIQQNPSLQAALVSRRIAELDQKAVRAARFPRIGLNTGYNFNQSQAALGFATQNTGRGFTYGVTASLNIFNGFLQRQNERNAAVRIDNSQLNLNKINQNIKAQLAAAYQTYSTNLALVNLESKNQDIAQRNLDITLDKFRIGSIAPIELREAQLNLVAAQVRLSTAMYQAKLAEISLKEIAGNINL
ncbi:TolC family protein [Adhaeribacter rhizoryzae]|uniref:TolC family protein n=1 Tax=Adhaeribacter rhizoryzae TaxID=2607907 RepID=A0A5M6DPZ1_9BACT|nr:TolC family protein [Adhaeribacter rhizoryzae]KAA5548289.1 TolC family protein [Adhaeribacter rhizoryzae]